MTTLQLHPHQLRVVDELNDLGDRTQKLYAFIGSQTFNSLDFAERRRLLRQATVMAELAQILTERVAAFG